MYEGNYPQFFEHFVDPGADSIRHDSWQSAEGGRFFQDVSRCLILEVDDFDLNVPDNFRWLTLSQIQSLMRFSNVINGECRDLLSCIYFSGASA